MTPWKAIFRINGCSNIREYDFSGMGDIVSVRQLGQAADVIIERHSPQPVSLKNLEKQLEDSWEIPPYTATLGVAESGSPLLINIRSSGVGSILAPKSLIPVLVRSLQNRHTEKELVFISDQGQATGIIQSCREAHPVVVLVASANNLHQEVLDHGPSAGVYVIAYGENPNLSFGVIIVDVNGTVMFAEGGGQGKSTKFVRAVL